MAMEMQVPRPLYYFLVTTSTQFILAVGAIIVLLPIGLLGHLPWGMMGFLLTYNIIVATLAGMFLAANSAQNKTPVLKGEGLVLGHLVGLILGAFIGIHNGGIGAAIVGAIVLYFLVGWLGSKISFAMGCELDRLTSAPTETSAEKLIRSAAQRKTNPAFVYGAIVPASLLMLAIFMKSSGLTLPQYPEVLPTARIVLIVLSVLAILIPWLRRSQRKLRPGPRHLAGWGVFFAGLGLALAPAIFGFMLFIASGMSISELTLFAVVASVAMTTWAVARAKS